MAASTSIDKDLETLLTAIQNLPASAQSGRRNDPLGKYLTPGQTKGNNPRSVFPSHKDGAYFVFNHEWEHVFQKQPGDPDDKLQKLVSHGHGKHGLILAHAWARHYATVAKPDERDRIQLRVQTLLNLITESIGTIGPNVINVDSDSGEEGGDDSGDAMEVHDNFGIISDLS
ncbi:hypothetical protein DFH08DRAFT_437576 [Mycena albidolilacea]|uniref:Uncharacterized protein n=1 Tax=Mycena albidolilacea TaxID=1033008 RepID=A0AAD7EZU0_9AGAR|nr:hypothetical protein DFH08DRAFT_437576 [Mycena albidolilacea]